ncbi:dihydrolipoyllysine-residue acetyltransferase [Halomonas korlensis]|uniref:Acetyltransferase component of pyruvate dehydrogenase complex n=1 Tax=Halomonas korlensis TaxID=463301 RepID=A0A1I7KLK5_9GAMM|nr:dihydrolipoyllysine-residue acetyltransferase [Halomonas korlensis]SFU98327.1 pyruvate dehydrogenase E2 component (dihydrolipoamide acetyltransferase) [Halomonas korlensis]
MAIQEIKVPDIGDFTDVPIIELHVQPGDSVQVEDPLITVESDKASMDVPAPAAGTVKEVKVKVGDTVSEGSTILMLEAEGEAPSSSPAPASAREAGEASAPSGGGVEAITVPDIGDFGEVPIIEIHVQAGDRVQAEDPLITLESDKASMDVPAPKAGTVKEVKVKVGDNVSKGSLVLLLESGAGEAERSAAPVGPVGEESQKPQPASAPSSTPSTGQIIDFSRVHASPSARRIARELEVDLTRVPPTGLKGRVTKEDIQAFAKGGAPAAATAGGEGMDLLPWPKVDFSKFGPVETQPLSRIKKISGANLHRNWVRIPHVTNHDEADITDLEAFRVQFNKENEKAGIKVSMLAFMIKAAVASLKRFPEFNASLDGDNLIYKQYYHIGFAADTPNGLVVPVIRDADQKNVAEIAQEMGALAKLARDGKLKPDQMQGGCFTISSLGGIGGLYFTPIINAPEVAIMGVCRSYWKQVSPDGKQSDWRFMLPLSLSWDHRVIDGAAAARFNVHFANLLADMRRIIM